MIDYQRMLSGMTLQVVSKHTVTQQRRTALSVVTSVMAQLLLISIFQYDFFMRNPQVTMDVNTNSLVWNALGVSRFVRKPPYNVYECCVEHHLS